MEIKSLFVTKRFNTYADTFLMLGLARIAEDALRYIKDKVNSKQKLGMSLIDEGTHYRIEFKQPVNLENLKKLPYTHPFPVVYSPKKESTKAHKTSKENTDSTDIPIEAIFNIVYHKEQRDLYLKNFGRVSTEEDILIPPDPRTQNGDLINSIRHAREKNESLFREGWKLRDKYGELIFLLFKEFSSSNGDAKNLIPILKKNGWELPDETTATIYQPTAIQGVNYVKANGIVPKSQKIDWLTVWLIANGLFAFGVSESVKIAKKKYNWRLLALEPKNITFENYQKVLDRLRQFNNPYGNYGAARFDAELALRFCQEFIKNYQLSSNPIPAEDEYLVNKAVGGFIGTQFDVGQTYTVKDIFTLGLPKWIKIAKCSNSQDYYKQVQDYYQVLEEHLSVVKSLKVFEDKSSSKLVDSEMLDDYRTFITGNDLQGFLSFQISYAEHIIRCLTDSKTKPSLFSTKGLDIMIKEQKDRKKRPLSDIVNTQGFRHIAEAINRATVYAGEIKTKDGKTIKLPWERNYGLAQRLSSQSSKPEDFVRELSLFLQSYEAENLRLQKNGETRRRISPKPKDLDELIKLLDEFDTSVVANLLIAYGYANWAGTKDGNRTDDNDGEVAEDSNSNTEE